MDGSRNRENQSGAVPAKRRGEGAKRGTSGAGGDQSKARALPPLKRGTLRPVSNNSSIRRREPVALLVPAEDYQNTARF